MAVRRVQLRRGSTNDHTANGGFTGAVGEITVDTTTKSIRVHDGAEAGGFDLLRADMSNNLAVVGNINFTDAPHVIGGDINTVGNAANILDLGDTNTTIRVRGTLDVNTQVTQQDLLISERVIVLADGKEGIAHTDDSIGVLFTRPLATVGEGGAAQDPALLYWDEANNLFRVETNNVTEGDADWRGGSAADLTLGTLYAQTSVDVNDNNITNVGEIQLDSIIYNDDLNTITIKAKDNQAGAFVVKADAGDEETYISIDATDATESLTLGVPSKEIVLRGNLTTLGTNANPGVNHTIQVETTTLVAGQDLTIEAGTTSLAGNTSGGDLILSTGGGTGTGTASMQFKTLVANGLTPAERMRIHTDGNVGINENAPETLLHISGADTAILTLENTTGGNAQDDDPTTISFKGSGEALALAEIVGAHDGVADDDKGVLIFKPNNDGGPTEALRLDSALKATFSGAVEIASTLDLTEGAISNVTDIAVNTVSDNDGDGVFVQLSDTIPNALVIKQGAEAGGGEEYINIDTDALTLTLAQATNLSSTLTVTGTSNLDGGIAVDGTAFTVAGDGTGNVDTEGTLQVDGDTTLGANGLGASPNLTIIEHTGGNTTFEVLGASGNTTIGGTLAVTSETTLSNTLNIEQGVVDGIVFNSDRLAEADQDAALIKVLDDNANNAHGVLTWDDGEGSFSFSGSKLNSVLDITVGALGTPSTTISTSGAISTSGTTPYLTLKNTDGGNADGDSETRVIFQDDTGADLARIQGSHDGVADDTKGDLIFSTNSGAGLSEALRLDSANLATFAGDVTAQDITASNGTINVGSNGATIVATNATTLTLTEDTIVANGDLQVNGNITGDADEAKEIFTASVAEVSTITLGGGGTVITGGKLRLGSNIIENSASETTITLDANQRTTLSGDLAIVGGANGGLAATTILLGEDAARDSKITVVARTGANDGQDLTIEAGSTATDVGNQNGGDLILSSGGGDGTGTSNLILKTKISGSDAPTEKIRVIGSGFMGIGETSPDSILHLSHASAPTVTLQNLTGGNNAGDRATVLTFVGETGAGVEGELGNITVSHDTAVADQAGKIVFSTFATVDWQAGAVNAVAPVLTLDSTQQATFAGSVIIAGNLQVDGTTTTINTATLDVEDTVIRLNKGQAGAVNTNDIGIYFERGDANNDGGVDNDPSAIFYWDEGDDIFKLGLTTSAHTATDFGANTTLGGLQLGSIVLKDNEAVALDIKRQDPDNTSMIKFVTTNGAEEIVFGSTLEIPTNSTIGTLTLADGSITDSGGAISFGDETLTTSGLASLDGGIDVNNSVFSVNNAGVTTIANTLTLNEATGNLSDLDVQSNGTSVFKVDVSANEAIIKDGTLKTNKIQASTDANDSFQMYLKDNTGLGFVISNVGDTVDFLTINTTTGSELITLVQDTSISETLTVVGDTTLEAEVNIEQANVNGIYFNSDLGANPSIDAALITIDGGSDKSNVVLAWDTTDNAINLNAESSLHLQGLGGANAALTIGGALKANATISMTSAGKITATTLASAFASGTTIGDVTYNDAEIQGANTNLSIKSKKDLILQVDSDQGGGIAGVHSFSFLSGAGTEIANLDESGNLQIDGDLSVDGGDATITSGQDTDANLVLKSDAGDDAGDSWGITAVANSDQLTIGNDKAVAGTYAPILTLTGNAVATSTNATFAGEVTISGSGTNALDFTNANTTIGNSIGNATLTLGATASTVAIPGDLTIATTKSITLNSGAAGADADIVVDRTDGNNAVLRWVEGNSRFEIDNADGNLYSILTENDSLFSIKGADDVAFTEIKQTNGTQILFDGLNDAIGNNQGLLFKVVGNTVQASFAGVVSMPGTFLAATSVESGFIKSTGQLLASGLTQVGSLNITQTAGAAKTSILLNSDNADAPADAEDVSIAVERGTATNATVTWDEGDDRWTLDQGEGSTNAIVTTKASEGARYECTSPAFAGNAITLTAPDAVENKHAYFLSNGATAGTVNLFDLTTGYDGYVLQIFNTGTNTLTVDGSGGQQVDGADTKDVVQGASLTLMAFGTDWFVV